MSNHQRNSDNSKGSLFLLALSEMIRRDRGAKTGRDLAYCTALVLSVKRMETDGNAVFAFKQLPL